MSNTIERYDDRAPALLKPIASAREVLESQAAVTELIRDALTSGTDYGIVPGTGGKPSLFKAGAERLNNAFGVYPDYETIERDIDHDRETVYFDKYGKEKKSLGLYRYIVKCTLRQRGSEAVIATGIGSCSTLESKYISRPRDTENTVLKMSQKRAFVAATLNGYGLSDRFTMDVEDLKPEDHDIEPRPTQRTPETATPEERQRNAGMWLSRTVGITPKTEPFDAFKTKCVALGAEWRDVALRAEQEGVATYDELMLYVAALEQEHAAQAESSVQEGVIIDDGSAKGADTAPATSAAVKETKNKKPSVTHETPTALRILGEHFQLTADEIDLLNGSAAIAISKNSLVDLLAWCKDGGMTTFDQVREVAADAFWSNTDEHKAPA